MSDTRWHPIETLLRDIRRHQHVNEEQAEIARRYVERHVSENLNRDIERRHIAVADAFKMCADDLEAALKSMAEGQAEAPVSEAHSTPQCVIGEYCSKHGFIHGAEAEELRERVERILAEVDHEGDDAAEALDRALRVMLDEVDARDSAAFTSGPDGLLERAPVSEAGEAPPTEKLNGPADGARTDALHSSVQSIGTLIAHVGCGSLDNAGQCETCDAIRKVLAEAGAAPTPKFAVEAWDDGDQVVTMNGAPIGQSIARWADANKIAEWLPTALTELRK